MEAYRRRQAPMKPAGFPKPGHIKPGSVSLCPDLAGLYASRRSAGPPGRLLTLCSIRARFRCGSPDPRVPNRLTGQVLNRRPISQSRREEGTGLD